MDKGQERRKKERFKSNLFAEVINLTKNQHEGRGVVVDVSVSGVALDTEADLERGTEVEIHVEVPLDIKAKVVRRISSGQIRRYGLLFQKQTILDKFLLKKILKGRLHTKKV